LILISEPTTQGDVRSCINFEEVQKIEKIIHGESNNKNEKKKSFSIDLQDQKHGNAYRVKKRKGN